MFFFNSDCGPVPFLDNGAFIMFSGSATTHGAMAETTCDTGHIPSALYIFCEEHGFWSSATCMLAGKYLLKINSVKVMRIIFG